MPHESSDTAEFARDEYRALRAAITRRGQLRVTLIVVGLFGWAAALLAVLVWATAPVFALVPLVLVVATFEAILQLHVGAERIGRFLLVFYEERADDGPRWERTIGQFGAPLAGSRTDPLFAIVFVMVVTTNLLALMLPGPTVSEVATLGLLHAAVVLRVVSASRAGRRQRTDDEARFRAIRDAGLRPS